MDQTKQIRQISAHRESAPRSELFHHPSFWLPAAETIIGTGLIAAIGLAMPTPGWGLLNINPHPLWIIAAAIAARYGARAGYFAGALAAVTYCAFLVARTGGALAQIDSSLLVQPLLMFITGAALGELTDAREQRLARIEGRSRGLETALTNLWERYRKVSSVKDALNKRIIFGADSHGWTGPNEPRRESYHVLENLPDEAARR